MAHRVRLCRPVRNALAALTLCLGMPVAHAGTPEIRTSAQNEVPRCVTPQRLMTYLKSRNPNIDSRFADIANSYKRHGETWRVRWDYAFFQMAVETNFLSFKRGDGRWGDVKPKQNNFAGLGTTGGGVPGDSYPDMNTGVRAQIEHLVVYSGERIAKPVAPRTKLKQDDILLATQRAGRAMTFADLSRRWAADRHYGAAIEWVAGGYRSAWCNGAEDTAKATTKIQTAQDEGLLEPAAALGGPGSASDGKAAPVRTIWSRPADASEPAIDAPEPPARVKPAVSPAPAMPEAAPAPVPPGTETAAIADPLPVPSPVEVPPESKPAAQAAGSDQGSGAFAFAAGMNAAADGGRAPQSAPGCRVLAASYGGTKSLLVQAKDGGETHYTVLTVLDGFEGSMLENYVKAHAPGGSSIGTFATKDEALARARELCPETPHT